MRQLYLDCGAVDVAVELGDDDLLAAVERRWRDLVRTRTYLTGGMGSRHRDEAFGDPYELPPDRAYAETCAAIASLMLAWRLLLATGEPAYADAIERAVYNGVLPAVSATGTEFFYVNPLQRRTHRSYEPPGHGYNTVSYEGTVNAEATEIDGSSPSAAPVEGWMRCWTATVVCSPTTTRPSVHPCSATTTPTWTAPSRRPGARST